MVIIAGYEKELNQCLIIIKVLILDLFRYKTDDYAIQYYISFSLKARY